MSAIEDAIVDARLLATWEACKAAQLAGDKPLTRGLYLLALSMQIALCERVGASLVQPIYERMYAHACADRSVCP